MDNEMRTRDILKELRHEKYETQYTHAIKHAEIKADLMGYDGPNLEKELKAIDEVNRCRDLYTIALADLIATLVEEGR